MPAASLIHPEVNDLIEFNYTNWKGLTQTRRCYVLKYGYGTTPQHSEPAQWFLIGEDPEKGYRSFAVKDMRAVTIIRRAVR